MPGPASDSSDGSTSGSGGGGIARLGFRGRYLMPPAIATVSQPTAVNHRKTANPNVLWSIPTPPKLPSWRLPHNPSNTKVSAATSDAVPNLAIASDSGNGRRAHCCPSATPDDAPTISSATQAGPSGGCGAAASTGRAGMSPPKTVNELNVAKPKWALDPTAIAAVATITFGTYRIESRVRLNWPNIELVIAYRSCIVDQCTTSEAAATIPDSPSSASTPAIAARSESPSQSGSGDATRARRPMREPTPMNAPMACTISTLRKARNALGVCNSVMTDPASWMTASAIAAISR